uniref:Ig-like domain-containing protein n=1 Tax=Seriola dumerili TaxID=41447 RepID=A0A3B4UEM8_SERDU
MDLFSVGLYLLTFYSLFCNSWKVEYQQQCICAVKGSSVVIPCSFYHPANLRVKRVTWGHVKFRHLKGHIVFSSNFKKVTTRFQYIGDKHHDCSLKIHQVKHNDAGKYSIRFNSRISRWPGNVGPSLKVVGKTMKEGDSVNLTCINSCDGGDLSSAITWFKNGKPLNQQSVLFLSKISSTNSGNYTCSLRTHEGATSGVISLDVEYGPKNTSVSVRPSTEEDTGSNITLICSSHANPPVENYTWFKICGGDIVDVGHQPVFFAGESGQYLCSVSNKHGSQNSSVVCTLRSKDSCSEQSCNTLPLFCSTLGNIYQRCTCHCYCCYCCYASDCDHCYCHQKVSCVYAICCCQGNISKEYRQAQWA